MSEQPPTAPLLSATPRMENLHQGTRRRAALLVSLLEAALFCTGAVTTWLLPVRADIEWIAFLVIGLACAFFSARLIAAQRADDEEREATLSAILIALGALGYIQRVAFAYHGPLLDDPAIYAFRPILAFFPFVALAAITLTRASFGVVAVWAFWVLITLVTISGMAAHPGMTWQRDGVAVMVLWTLLACPLFLLLLQTIPPYEDVLKDSEEELEEAKANSEISEQLRQSEHRFRMAVKGLQVGVWEHELPTSGVPGRWWCSERFYQLLGYTPEELPMSSRSMLALLDDKDRGEISRLATESVDDEGFSADVRIRVKNRRYRWFNIKAHWERDENGRPYRLTGAISDIHDRVQAEEALRAAKSELQRLAYSDPLTGVSNRRGFDEQLGVECGRTRRTADPLSLLIIDLDHFKHYNDFYGHLSGDESLRVMGTLLQTLMRRPADLLARIGGEEFAVLLPDTAAEGAMTIAQQILHGVYSLNLAHESSPFGRVTCSIGIVTSQEPNTEPQSLFEAADKALYTAKQKRNDICVGRLAPPATAA